MDLKIDLLTTNYIVPKKKNIKKILLNMWGIEKIDINRLKFMADLFCNHEEATKIMINLNKDLKEQLEIFKRVHKVQILEK